MASNILKVLWVLSLGAAYWFSWVGVAVFGVTTVLLALNEWSERQQVTNELLEQMKSQQEEIDALKDRVSSVSLKLGINSERR